MVYCSEDMLWRTHKGVLGLFGAEKAGLLCTIKWGGGVFSVAGEPAMRGA